MTMSAGYVSHLLKNAFFNINSLQPRSMWENSGVVSLLAVLGIVVGTVLVGVTGKYRYCSIIWLTFAIFSLVCLWSAVSIMTSILAKLRKLHKRIFIQQRAPWKHVMRLRESNPQNEKVGVIDRKSIPIDNECDELPKLKSSLCSSFPLNCQNNSTEPPNFQKDSMEPGHTPPNTQVSTSDGKARTESEPKDTEENERKQKETEGAVNREGSEEERRNDKSPSSLPRSGSTDKKNAIQAVGKLNVSRPLTKEEVKARDVRQRLIQFRLFGLAVVIPGACLLIILGIHSALSAKPYQTYLSGDAAPIMEVLNFLYLAGIALHIFYAWSPMGPVAAEVARSVVERFSRAKVLNHRSHNGDEEVISAVCKDQNLP
eukprot:CAMPEP_0184487002 /NCGR_PEP_ID=MMETSP0113_2-20130426/8907_1 /TAXON_ID=91329 /ORGANISM="Norrisiella sphaerica, Strain BC52" /LENGTH=371 /DNA_ID=CAMNT_0026869109 /DNA_START=397 /DNA_END=1512 /DNA_ORIENTATION=+